MRERKAGRWLRLCRLKGPEDCPVSSRYKQCFGALAAMWLCVGVIGGAPKAGVEAEAPLADKPPVEITWEVPVEQPQLLEAITLPHPPAGCNQKEEFYENRH